MQLHRSIVMVALLASFGAGACTARGEPNYLTAFNAAYPGNTLASRMQSETGSSCNICHHPTTRSTPGNCYRSALAARIGAGRSISQAIGDIDAQDSDGDGVSNHDEILLARADLAGQVGYNPGLIGPTGTDPCGTSPTAAVTHVSETPVINSCHADFNRTGGLTVQDIFDFLAAYFASLPAADFNGVGGLTVQDIFDFLAAYFTGC